MKNITTNKQLNVKSMYIWPIIYALLSIGISTSSVFAAEDRFAPPSINASLDHFDARFNSSTVNIDFIVAQVLNNARQIERAGDTLRENALLFRNETNDDSSTNYGTNSGSVVIPPGTSADTIIIINQNDGDSYAISR